VQGIFDDLNFPDEWELIALEELGDSLKPLEGLTKRLCSEHFTALQADKVFQIALDALRRQQTNISDKILAALETRYEQRKNIVLLSALSFLTDPMDYESSDEGLLEFCELRVEMKALCRRLFPEQTTNSLESQHSGDPRPSTSQELSTFADPGSRPSTSGDPGFSSDAHGASTEPKLSYGEKLSAMFDKELMTIGVPKKRKTCDIFAEMSLAAKTGELTDRLVKLLKALESVQASSVESERAFSTAGSFVTKIRNRMGDNTLDNYCFARQKLQMTNRLVAITFSLWQNEILACVTI
jgi:hypothetical protein